MGKLAESLDGRLVLVTGASAGIGAAIVRDLVAEGAHVAGVARNADGVEALGVRGPGRAVGVPADLTDAAASVAAVHTAVEALGGLDAIVHSAGAYHLATLEEGVVEDWQRMFDLNALAILTMSQAALPQLRASSRGHIVTINSIGGRRIAAPQGTVYSASKFAAHAITEGLRKDLLDDGIRVTVVAPGVVRTGVGEANRSEARRAEVRAAMDAHSIEPEHLADAVTYVLSRPPHVSVREMVVAPTNQPS